jgi:hypothetical protein
MIVSWEGKPRRGSQLKHLLKNKKDTVYIKQSRTGPFGFGPCRRVRTACSVWCGFARSPHARPNPSDEFHQYRLAGSDPHHFFAGPPLFLDAQLELSCRGASAVPCVSLPRFSVLFLAPVRSILVAHAVHPNFPIYCTFNTGKNSPLRPFLTVLFLALAIGI